MFTLTSSSFPNGSDIPKKYTCDGEDHSPALAWSGAPPRTKSFALIADDPDAPVGTWVHWVIFDIPSGTSSLPEGVAKSERLPDGSIQGKNDFQRIGYGGPCPPPGLAHRYFFRLYAVDRALNLPAASSKADVERSLQGHVLAKTELMGRYKRQ